MARPSEIRRQRPTRSSKANRPAAAPPADLTPRTPRGARSRDGLVQAARVVFERDGYISARLTDITAEAGTSIGSFYRYFHGKDDIFNAVLRSVEDEMLHPQIRTVSGTDDPIEMVRASNRAYLESYRRNARLMQLLDEVAIYNEDVKEFRQQRSAAFSQRNARAIRHLQQRGMADQSLDPDVTAYALGYMVARIAHARFVLEHTWDVEGLVETLTRLWTNALGLTRETGTGPT